MEISIDETVGMSSLSTVGLVILGLFATRMLFLHRRNQVSIMLPVAMLAGVLVMARTGHWESRRQVSAVSHVAETPTPSVVIRTAEESSFSLPKSSSMNIEDYVATVRRRAQERATTASNRLRATVERGVDRRRAVRDSVAKVFQSTQERIEPAAPVKPSPSPQIETTADGSMVKIPLSEATFKDYLGEDGTIAWESISSAFPEPLRQAYLMVPVPVSGAESVPSLGILASAMAQMTQSASAQVTTKLAAQIFDAFLNIKAQPQKVSTVSDASESIESPQPASPPVWMERLDDDPLVVTSGFELNADDANAALQQNVADALLTVAWNRVAGTVPDDRIRQQRKFQLTSKAVDASIQERFSDSVQLRAGDETLMQRQSALLQFPAKVEADAVQHVRQSVQNERAWTVAAAAVSVSVFVMLAAGLLQLAGSEKRLARYLGVPVVGATMLACFGFSAELVGNVVEKQNADYPSPISLDDTIIDHDAQAVRQ